MSRLVGRLAGPSSAPTAVFECLLDNYYIVHRTTRHVREDFPRAFESRLPTFAEGPQRALPVAWGLAREVVRIGRCRIELKALVEAARDFQGLSEVQASSGLADVGAGCGACARRCPPISPTFSAMS